VAVTVTAERIEPRVIAWSLKFVADSWPATVVVVVIVVAAAAAAAVVELFVFAFVFAYALATGRVAITVRVPDTLKEVLAFVNAPLANTNNHTGHSHTGSEHAQ
jgi:hypothetical protein